MRFPGELIVKEKAKKLDGGTNGRALFSRMKVE
jgi:hypothetical protein